MATVNDHLYKWVQYEADRPETLLVVCSCRSSYLPGICARDGGVSEPQNPFHSYGVSGESSQSPSIQKRHEMKGKNLPESVVSSEKYLQKCLADCSSKTRALSTMPKPLGSVTYSSCYKAEFTTGF